MKRNIIRTLFALLAASALITSCDPLEPDTYTATFYRIATVQVNEGKASLLIDYTGETFKLRNFSNDDDARRFEVEDGDRVIAKMSLSATGSIDINQTNLDELYKVPVQKIAETCPHDTMNLYYMLDPYRRYSLGSQQYPTIWSSDHILNITPFLYLSAPDAKIDFFLYPTGVKRDTLEMKLYSDISDCYNPSSSSTPYQSLFCFDMATMRNTSDTIENHRRDSLLSLLSGRDSIMVHVFMPDSIRVPTLLRNSKTLKDTIMDIYYYPKVSASTSVPFNF